MKITVVGTVNRDFLRFEDGKEVESLGGLLYSILTLAVTAPSDWNITPVSNVGEDIYESLMESLRNYPNINLEGLKKISSPNNAVHLRLSPGKEREEWTELRLPPIIFQQIAPHLNCDALMLNFTSGFELKLDTVRKTIDECPGLVYIDLHSLTLGIDERKNRLRRKIDRWREWIAKADFVQLTAEEAWSLSAEENLTVEEKYRVGMSIAKLVRQACLMTCGAEGVIIFTSGKFHTIKTEVIDNPVDTTGCGDVFGGSFLVNYLQTGDLLSSIEYGSRLAGAKCSFAGIENMNRLQELL